MENPHGVVSVGKVNKPVGHLINIRCDRQSVLGNPYYMENESMRDHVCDAYAHHFNDKVKTCGPFRDEVKRIFLIVKGGGNVNLQCWCAPKRCHCDTIKSFIDSHLPQELYLPNK